MFGINNFGLGRQGGKLPFTPKNLFKHSETGFWYDPSDLTTLFQNSAGTTPVTGVEQPVGLMLDKSGNGNNATQATSASRPTLSARYNLLEQTEAFDDAYWSKVNTTVTTNATTDPLGGNNADLLIPSVTTTVHYAQATNANIKGGTKIVSFYAKAETYSELGVRENTASGNYAVFDLTGGTVLETNTTASITGVGSGWYLCSYNYTSASTANHNIALYPMDGYTTGAPNAFSWAGDGIGGVYVFGIYCVESQYAHLPYQRVGDATATASDYDSSNSFPKYLKFDGTDDYMVVNGLSAASGPITAHFGYVTDDGESAGVAQSLFDAGTGDYNIRAANAGGRLEVNDGTNFANQETDVEALTIATVVVDNTSGDFFRVNGTQEAKTLVEVGISGSVAIGSSDTGAAELLDGNLYQAILRNTTSTTAEIDKAEAYINRKMGGGLL